MKTLDLDAVRAFVLAADLESFTRAGEILGTTQSAISLRLRRLESQVGHRLLERTPRQVRLSASGQAFLGVARELVETHDRATAAFDSAKRRLAIGISHQLVGTELPARLRRIKDQDPGLVVEMRVAGTRELMQAFERRELDAALVLRPEGGRKQGKVVYAEAFSWVAAIGWKPQVGRPLPLLTQGESCAVRRAAVRALDRAGIEWHEAFMGSGAALLGAAAAGGLGIAIMAKRAASSDTIDVGAILSLPKIPSQDVMLYSALRDRQSRDALQALAFAFR